MVDLSVLAPYNTIYFKLARLLALSFQKNFSEKLKSEYDTMKQTSSSSSSTGPVPQLSGNARIQQLETENKQLRNELHKQEQQCAEIQRYLDLSGVILIVFRQNEQIEMINQSGCELLGYQQDELLNSSWFDRCIPEEARADARQQFQQLFTGKGEAHLDSPVLTRDGQRLMIDWHCTLIHNKETGVDRLIYSGKDISQRRELEEQLRQSQKMEAVGRLAGGVAHDFNNLLTVILGYTQLLLADLDASDPIAESITEIDDAAVRAEALTQQLLTFSRRQIMEPKVIDLNKLLSEMVKMLHALMGEDIELITRLPEGLDPIRADPHHLEQVIMNLVVNAREAMPEGGRLVLETNHAEISNDNRQKNENIQSGRYVLISVSDNGRGMDRETRSKIFEPFFTTKEGGTGLGLATVYGIVRQSGGYIGVESKPEKGSVFTIYLPVAKADSKKKLKPDETHTKIEGAETILVVEDQHDVRQLICRSLRRYGYTILDAPAGDEALRLAERYKGEIDLVLTDVVMPKMSGRQLAEELSARYPALKILYMTGYTDDRVIHHGVRTSKTKLIQKPFAPRALAQRIRQMLDRV